MNSETVDRDIFFAVQLLKTETISGNCFCCLTEYNLKNMFLTYYFEGNPEVYSEMMLNSFSIEVFTENGNSCLESYHQICDICISKLREAYLFKIQIQTSQEYFKKKLCDLKENLTRIKEDCKTESELDDLSNDYQKSIHEDQADKIANANPRNKKIINIPKIPKKRKRNNHKKSKLQKKTDGFEPVRLPKIVTKLSYTKRLKNLNRKKKEELPYKLEKDAVTCEICNETFPVHSSLVQHMNVHFPNYICHVCAKVFATKSKLKSHVYRHQYIEKKCDICQKSCKGNDNLKKHIQTHLKTVDRYKCPQCPERFQTYYIRSKHLIDVHNDEPKKYKCKQCSKRFVQSCILNRHIRTVHLQEKNCVCLECGDAFFDKTGLSEHMLKHTGIKNYECDVCHKSYGRRFTLKEHMKIHTNEKKFVCTICGRAFTQKCTLKGHLKTHDKVQQKTQQTMCE